MVLGGDDLNILKNMNKVNQSSSNLAAKKRWLAVAIGIVILAVFARGAASIWIFESFLDTRRFQDHPKDQVLAANFRAHRAEFEQLLQMSRADSGLRRVYYEWSDAQYEKPHNLTRQRHDQ